MDHEKEQRYNCQVKGEKQATKGRISKKESGEFFEKRVKKITVI